jgi:hypothetical protein
MYPGYWDDYMEDGTGPRVEKDCVHTIWRIYKDGELLAENRDARKRILHKEHGFTKGQMKKFNNSEKLIELGYCLYSRKWNVVQKKWQDEVWYPVF